jgi:hypothetical protein
MQCAYCNQTLSEGDAFCSACGKQQLPAQVYPSKKPASNTMATAGVILGIIGLLMFLIALPSFMGLVFSIVGLVFAVRNPAHTGRGEAIVGLFMNVISIGCFLFFWIAYIGVYNFV